MNFFVHPFLIFEASVSIVCLFSAAEKKVHQSTTSPEPEPTRKFHRTPHASVLNIEISKTDLGCKNTIVQRNYIESIAKSTDQNYLKIA